jgi:hypothetical protein
MSGLGVNQELKLLFKKERARTEQLAPSALDYRALLLAPAAGGTAVV